MGDPTIMHLFTSRFVYHSSYDIPLECRDFRVQPGRGRSGSLAGLPSGSRREPLCQGICAGPGGAESAVNIHNSSIRKPHGASRMRIKVHVSHVQLHRQFVRSGTSAIACKVRMQITVRIRYLNLIEIVYRKSCMRCSCTVFHLCIILL
jgi:hypothetical protein